LRRVETSAAEHSVEQSTADDQRSVLGEITVAREEISDESESRRARAARATLEARLDGKPIEASALIVEWSQSVEAEAWTAAGPQIKALRSSARRNATDGKGRLELEVGPNPLGILILADGVAPKAVKLNLDDSHCVVDLDRGHEFGIRVTDESANPIAGARVAGWFNTIFSRITPDRVDPFEATIRGLSQVVAITDAEGEAVLGPFGAGHHIVEIEAEGFASFLAFPVLPIAPSTPAVVELARGARVEGQVRASDTGAPIEGARVDVISYRANIVERRNAMLYTDARGRFETNGAPANGSEVRIYATKSGYAATPVVIGRMEEREARFVDVDLRRSSQFKGVVRHAAGDPVDNAWVVAADPVTQTRIGNVRTRADGTFVLDEISADTSFILEVRAADGAYVLVPIRVPWPEDFEIALEPPAPLEGKLVTERYPIDNGWVRVAAEASYMRRPFEEWAEVDRETGRFEFPRVPRGTYRLDAFADRHAARRLPEIKVGSIQERLPIEILMQTGAIIQGKVISAADGEPIHRATIKLADISLGDDSILGGHGPGVDSDERGAFELSSALSDSRATLVISKDGYAETVDSFVAPPAVAKLERTVTLEPEGVLEIEIIRPDGKRAGSFYASARHLESRRRHVTSVTEQVGIIQALPSGKYTLECAITDVEGGAFGCNVGHNSLEVRAGETTRVVLSMASGGEIRGVLRGGSLEYMDRDLSVAIDPLDPVQTWHGLADVVSIDNSYRMPGIPAGRYEVVAATSQGQPPLRARREIEVRDGEVHVVDIEFGELELAGRIVGIEGQPVGNAILEIEQRSADPAARDGAIDSVQEARSLGDGSYSLAGLVAGSWPYSVTAEGHARLDGTIAILADPAGERQIKDFALEPEALIAVTVTDRNRSTLDNAKVEVFVNGDRTREPELSRTRRVDGAALVRRLGTGTHLLAVTHPGYFPHESRVALVGGRPLDVGVVLRRPAAIELKLKALSGAPLSEVEVEWIDMESGASLADWIVRGWLPQDLSMITSRDGTLLLRGLPEGRYRVRAPGIDAEIDVVVAPADEIPREVLTATY
jgi:hypothetical protein